ncbi:MAG: RagB/SusD family nutrient uptake outer membrane protein [Bacteroidota bacterium]
MKNLPVKTAIIFLTILHIGCKKLVEIDSPITLLDQKTLFQNDDLATSVITGVYADMASGQGFNSVDYLCGLSADEFDNYSSSALPSEYFNNQLSPLNTINTSYYGNQYNYIFRSNAVIEGVDGSTSLTPSTKSQLKGEALFIRAFCYFYLVNLYGPVPLQFETDYRRTRSTKRSSVNEVYQQIVLDLKNAENLLTDNYITTERVRPNRAAAQALLARVYLFMQDWSEAEKYSTLLISNSSTYKLLSPDEVFLKNSSEAIWQLFPPLNSNALEGSFFILTGMPTTVALSSKFIKEAFEINDKRSTSWINVLATSSGDYYYPYKYKTGYSSTPMEYSMVMRLGEQFLIRSEARAQQNNLTGAIDDLDKIRKRAELPIIKNTNPGISKDVLLTAIQKERRVELFSEWGHRWLDLKRTNQANVILSPVKSNWQETDILYPIPYDETSRNSNITQNLGY